MYTNGSKFQSTINGISTVKPNLRALKMRIANSKPILSMEQLKDLLSSFRNIIQNEPNLLTMSDPVTIVGDIHGQIYDMMNIMQTFQGRLGKQRVLFLGDYVDRGTNSIEVIVYLMALKVLYPKNVYMLRGNHESRAMTELYNFKTECMEKYSQDIYTEIMDVLDWLPLACIVNRRFFCVHGGISDKFSEISQINAITRANEIAIGGAICDLIWSDPISDDQGRMAHKVQHNNMRQCSIFFGKELSDQFLKKNNLSSIIRAHQVFNDGFRMHSWSDNVSDPPSVITIFSAPNYGMANNKAAILRIDSGRMTIRQFEQEDPKKYIIAQQFDVFRWTLPTILTTGRDMFARIALKFCSKSFPELENETLQNKIFYLLSYKKKQVTESRFQVRSSSVNHISHLASSQGSEGFFY